MAAGIIAVVSPHADTRDLYLTWLQMRRIAAVGVVPEAIASLSQNDTIAVVVVDVHGHDDWERCRGSAWPTALQGVPVVALTGWVAPDHRYREAAKSAGCAAYVLKPCSPQALAAVIERVRDGERGIEFTGERPTG